MHAISHLSLTEAHHLESPGHGPWFSMTMPNPLGEISVCLLQDACLSKAKGVNGKSPRPESNWGQQASADFSRMCPC